MILHNMKPLASFIRRHLPISSKFNTSRNPDPGQPQAEPQLEEGRKRGAPPDNPRDQSPPREFPSSGFELIEGSQKLEEETYSWYSAKTFYPAAIGEVFNDTYQVIAKLGYGSASTTWLCRNLQNHRYVTLKIYASDQAQPAREIAALRHINSVLATYPPSKHIGARSIRTLIEEFAIPHPKSSRPNLCLVFDPLTVSVGEVRKRCTTAGCPSTWSSLSPFTCCRRLTFSIAKLVSSMEVLLPPLPFSADTCRRLTAAGKCAKDIQEDNILFAPSDPAEWREVEEAEMAEPSARKVYKHHAIYASRVEGLPTPNIPVLSDFGEARLGKDSYGEHAMPDLYRAPEILLRIEWGVKIDIWALGLVVCIPEHLPKVSTSWAD